MYLCVNELMNRRLIRECHVLVRCESICPLLLCRLMMYATNQARNEPMVEFVCFHIALHHYRHYADVFEGIELVRYTLSSVCLRWNTNFSCDDCENTCMLFYHHRQSESMNDLPLFWVRSWNNDMRFMSFYVLYKFCKKKKHKERNALKNMACKTSAFLFKL